jgi:hypothetical protein
MDVLYFNTEYHRRFDFTISLVKSDSILQVNYLTMESTISIGNSSENIVTALRTGNQWMCNIQFFKEFFSDIKVILSSLHHSGRMYKCEKSVSSVFVQSISTIILFSARKTCSVRFFFTDTR